MGTEKDFEISTEDELRESETEDELRESETEDESYRCEEGECTEEESTEEESTEEESTENESQIDELKAKKGKQGIGRYCCQICGFVRSKRRRIKEHIAAHHGVEIDTAGEVDKLIQRNYIEETEIRESEAKEGNKGEIERPKEKNVRRYCCEFCGLTRSRLKLLKAHVISEHGKELGLNGEIDNFITKKCSEEDGLQEERAENGTKDKLLASKSRDIRRYCCQICGLIRAKRNLLKQHIISYHGVETDTKDEIEALIEKKNPEECIIFESEAQKSKKVENNGFKARDLRRYCCKLCGLIRSKRKLLKNHIKSEHVIEMGSEDEVDNFLVKKGSDDDQRRYSCQICGIIRSKRRILKLHVISSHGPEALKKDERLVSEGVRERSQLFCDLCGMSFRKLSHLQQHKISHSALRSFVCPVDGCLCSYKRQEHLNRHLIKHEGELFLCPKEDCKLQLSTLSNLKRHLKRHKERGESWQSQDLKFKETKKLCCPEPYCEKAFKYPSKLAKHLDDVHSTTYTEVICCEPGCLKYFTNAEALKEHLRHNHKRICCEICGSQQLKKQIKRHMRIHENKICVKSIACPYERCLHSYTTKSNLNQHIKSVHLGLKPFKCQFEECGMTFAHKSTRDNHEMSGAHCYVEGDFIEEDAAFQARPRGGRKRKAFTIDSLFRKRVAGPDQSTILDNGLSFVDWLVLNNGE